MGTFCKISLGTRPRRLLNEGGSEGSTQQLKSLHQASQPQAGAGISNASNNPPDVCLGRTFLDNTPVHAFHRRFANWTTYCSITYYTSQIWD